MNLDSILAAQPDKVFGGDELAVPKRSLGLLQFRLLLLRRLFGLRELLLSGCRTTQFKHIGTVFFERSSVPTQYLVGRNIGQRNPLSAGDPLLHGRPQVAGFGPDSRKVFLVERRISRQILRDEADAVDTLDNGDVVPVFVPLVFGIHVPADISVDERNVFVGCNNLIVALRCIVQYFRFHSAAIFCR